MKNVTQMQSNNLRQLVPDKKRSHIEYSNHRSFWTRAKFQQKLRIWPLLSSSVHVVSLPWIKLLNLGTIDSFFWGELDPYFINLQVSEMSCVFTFLTWLFGSDSQDSKTHVYFFMKKRHPSLFNLKTLSQMCISGWSDWQFEKQLTQTKETTNSSWDSMTNQNIISAIFGEKQKSWKTPPKPPNHLPFHIVTYLLDKPSHES